VKEILDDPDGWRTHGYIFTKSSNPIDINIQLASPKKIEKICNLYGLSCYDPVTHIIPTIYINYKNWNGGSKSNLSLANYRYYVINHEIGHFLGFSHPDKNNRCGPDGVAYIMNQMSLGEAGIYPCLYESYKP
jgi:hypothetical protein